MLSGLLYLPLTALLRQQVLVGEGASFRFWEELLGATGQLTAIFQVLGFSRWIFLVPFRSRQYLYSTAASATQQTIELFYETMNRYLGMTLGEHLGFIGYGMLDN